MPRSDITAPPARRIALYPGAFRPPHAAHLAAVRWLQAQPDISDIVIIVSGRDRIIEGTDCVLDATCATRIWREYLGNCPGITIESVTGTAIGYALDYLDRVVDPTDSLVFAIGAEDYEDGDKRFAQVQDRAGGRGIRADIVAVPTSMLTVRGTDLRRALSAGLTGARQSTTEEHTSCQKQSGQCIGDNDQGGDEDRSYAKFLSLLPAELSADARVRVLSICLQQKKSVDEAVRERVMPLLLLNKLALNHGLHVIRPGTQAPVFRTRDSTDRPLIIKCATLSLDKPDGNAKSRQRLAVEKRVLARLADLFSHSPEDATDVDFPSTVLWLEEHRLLVMSAVCSEGITLQEWIVAGKIDPDSAASLGRFLARCHFPVHRPKPVHGDVFRDYAHWLSVYQRYQSRQPWVALRGIAARGLFHLDLQLRHIRVSKNGRLGIVDFESAGTVGDPAFELGRVVGQVDRRSRHTAQQRAGKQATRHLMEAYRAYAGEERWQSMRRRVERFRDVERSMPSNQH